jgi:excisionase family DNA binding protein
MLAYSIVEAMHVTGLGRSTIYQAMAAGKLRANKMGSRTLIPAEELRRFIDALPPARPTTHAA